MRLVSFVWQILLSFGISFHQFYAQSPPDFISLDCGLSRGEEYNDPITGLYYSTDITMIEAGEAKSISPEFKTDSLPRQYFNVRSFPGSNETRSCYTLWPLHGKGHQISLRVAFMYGNYDELNQTPAFDLYLGVNYWERVTFKNSSSIFTAEILHVPRSEYLDVCLANTGHGTPFISVIELRSRNSSNLIYFNNVTSLKVCARWDIGSADNNVVRYKDDLYDRIWKPMNVANTSILKSNASSFYPNWLNIPPIVLSTAAQVSTLNDSLTIGFAPEDPADVVYMHVHFVEVVPNQPSREMIVYFNGNSTVSAPLVPSYLTILTTYTPFGLPINPTYEVTIVATANSKLPAMLNAIEIFTLKQFNYNGTHENDVAEMSNIKETYSIRRNWEGDPCLPKVYGWSGISCSYDKFESPRIISLNMSSSGLSGSIAQSIANLPMLQHLDLSYNNLIGEVPDFLSWLPSLKYLSLKGNNFTGSIPRGLIEKSNNGSLIFISNVEIPSNHTSGCENGACKKNNRAALIASLASVGTFLVALALSFSIYLIFKRRKQVVQKQKVIEEENHENTASSIETKVRQFSFSEIMSFIKEQDILGRGGFGTVYHGCITGTEVAIKVFKVSREQESKDFKSEVKILETVHHKNLTKILGYCNEGIHKAIIFELIENGNLNKYLSERSLIVLSWEVRVAILIGVGQGLEYLHHCCEPPIIHRDIKPENVLLTKEFEAKLSDFGLSRLFPFQTTNVAGTPGYLDPDQCMDPSMLTEKVDIYSFGVLMLVVISGKYVVQGTIHISQWINHKIECGDIQDIVDPRLEGNYDLNVASKVVELAMACVVANSSQRPNMNYVVKELRDCLPTYI